MSNRKLRFIALVGAICIIGILATQGYWFREAYNVKEKQFEHHVNMALKTVAENIYNYNQITAPANHVVKTLSDNYFIVTTNSPIDPALLENWLIVEFQKRDLLFDFEYGIYDCMSENIVFGNSVALSNDKEGHKSAKTLPEWSEENYYFGVLFPGKQSGIMGQLTFWWLSSVLLALVTAYFGYLIWTMFKQKRLSEIQKDFVNNMAHEFKTPLATIALSAQMLEKMNSNNPHFDHAKYITAIKEESARLKKQVENTLHLSTENAHDFHLTKEPVHLSTLLEALICQLKNNPVFGTLSIDLENNSQNDRIIGDAFHLENIFFNLIENAFKYNENEQKLVRIRLENKDHGLVVTVNDNGLGISSEKQKLIFNKFYRVNTGNLHDQKGFGLGLYYVQQIVKAHQGKIEVASELGKGSAFSIYLPAGF